MSLGVDESLKAVKAVKELVLGGIEISKNGINIRDLPKLFAVLADLKALADSAPSVMPEFKDLDAAEVGQLSEALYAAVKECLEALK
jgi:hypothetical protein